MTFIQKASRRYDRLRRNMENNISKGRYEHPTTVKSAYNFILEWQTNHRSMQGGKVQREIYIAFLPHNEQGEGKRTAKDIQEDHLLQVRPTQPLHRIMYFQRGRTIKSKGEG